jgi:hypothetical protein
MVLSDSINNDPVKEALCKARTTAKMPGKVVPLFYIDDRYVASVRSHDPDATFIAIDTPGAPQLVDCYLSSGTGRYEPVSFSPEAWFWHLILPNGITRVGNTRTGLIAAGQVCRESAQIKNYRPHFDHFVTVGMGKEMLPQPRSPGARPVDEPGAVINGKTIERYDVLIWGKAFYGPANPDLLSITLKCLVKPNLEIKSIEFQPKR